MKTTGAFTILLIGLLGSAFAAEDTACSNTSFSEVRSIGELPSEIGKLLTQGRYTTLGIADHGAPFRKTDVILAGEEQLPVRRFDLAAVSANCIFVAVEHGGRGYSVEVWVFERIANQWHGIERERVFRLPTSLQDLIANASK